MLDYLECPVCVLQAEVISLQVPAKLVLATVHWPADSQARCLLHEVVAGLIRPVTVCEGNLGVGDLHTHRGYIHT